MISKDYLDESMTDKEGIIGRAVIWAFLKWSKAVFTMIHGTTRLQIKLTEKRIKELNKKIETLKVELKNCGSDTDCKSTHKEVIKLANNTFKYQSQTLKDLNLKLKGIEEFLDAIKKIEEKEKDKKK
jgi:hypothetical protein